MKKKDVEKFRIDVEKATNLLRATCEEHKLEYAVIWIVCIETLGLLLTLRKGDKAEGLRLVETVYAHLKAVVKDIPDE